MYTKRGNGIRIELMFREKAIHKSFYGIDEKSLMYNGKISEFTFADFKPLIHDVFIQIN